MRRTPRLTPRKLPTQARAKATYAAIVEAGARVLARDGYEALTTNRVAEVAGIGIGSLYEYFPNKHAIIASVITATVDDVLAEIGQALEHAIEGGGEVGLSSWIGAMFDAVQRRRALVAVLAREVPYLHQVPAMRSLRGRLLGLATRGQRLAPSPYAGEHLEAVLYLLPLMVSSAVVESVTRPPRGIAREDLEAALVGVLEPFLFPAATDRDARSAGRGPRSTRGARR